MYNFGLGSVTLTPGGANPTPVQVAVLSDVAVDIGYDMKELRGQYQVPVDAARGPAKITGKAKNAAIFSSLLFAALGGAVAPVAGSKIGITGEAGVIPGTPFQITVAQSATWYEDLGVVDLTAGKQLTRVAAAPATGQYSVAAGVYTFAAADTAHNVAISYSYTAAAVGKTITLNNQPMGASTPYILSVYNTYGTKSFGWRFPAVHIPKLNVGMKAEAYTEQDLDFLVVQDPASTKIMDIFVAE